MSMLYEGHYWRADLRVFAHKKCYKISLNLKHMAPNVAVEWPLKPCINLNAILLILSKDIKLWGSVKVWEKLTNCQPDEIIKRVERIHGMEAQGHTWRVFVKISKLGRKEISGGGKALTYSQHLASRVRKKLLEDWQNREQHKEYQPTDCFMHFGIFKKCEKHNTSAHQQISSLLRVLGKIMWLLRIINKLNGKSSKKNTNNW